MYVTFVVVYGLNDGHITSYTPIQIQIGEYY